MAIIKPIQWKGFTPYWWEITQISYDVLQDNTQVYLACYPDSESYSKDKNSMINNLIYSTILPGKITDKDEITALVLQKEKNAYFFDGVHTNSSYNIVDNDSPIFVDISDDPNSGIKRKAECIAYKFMLRNNLLIMTLRIHFYPEIDGTPTLNSSLDRDITWVVDDYYEVSEGIGEFTYFNTTRITNRLLDEEILTLGIQHGDKQGKINSKLYGIT